MRPPQTPTIHAERIQRALDRTGLTRRDLAQRWGIHPSCVSRVLHNERPRLESRRRMAELLTELGDPCQPQDLESAKNA